MNFKKEVCLIGQDRFIPYNKLSKKKKREYDNKRRKDWGTLNPVTRKSKNLKIYDRDRFKRLEEGVLF